MLRERGAAALAELPAIGVGLASAIAEMAATGHLSRLERLRGGVDPEGLLQSVPGIGASLAHLLHERLHIGTLEALEIAAYDDRLEQLPGIGPRRAAAIRANLAALLGRVDRPREPSRLEIPAVAQILDVDRQYRRDAAAGKLPLIAPRRFNPEHKAWLPVLHTERSPWHFTALFSNTARAHELGRTRDWVVLYYHDDDHREAQRTVVTETHGPLTGRRVVRGHEGDCAAYYAAADTAVTARSA